MHEHFDRDVLQLRNDSSGFGVLHAHTGLQNASSMRTRAAMDRLHALSRGNTGLLARLRKANDEALKVANIISPHLMRSETVSVEDMLLDVQERVFHAKLDSRKPNVVLTNDGTFEKNAYTYRLRRQDVSAYTRRTLPTEMCLKTPTKIDEANEGQEFAVTQIESLKVRLRDKGGKSYDIGNRRIADAIADLYADASKRRAELDAAMRAIELELTDTPYSASVPDPTTPARPFAMATVAMKAFVYETNRMRELLTVGMKKYRATNDDAARAAAFEECIRRWERRAPVGNVGVTEEGERTREGDGEALNSSSQAPLFVITKLRSERRSIVQLRMLARGDDGDRRYPGYPVEESEERGHKEYNTHKPNDSHAPPEPVRSLDIQFIAKRFQGSFEVVVGKIVMENGAIDRLGNIFDGEPKECIQITKDAYDTINDSTWTKQSGGKHYLKVQQQMYDEQYRRYFGSYAKENVLVLNLAKKRYYENIAKRENAAAYEHDRDVVVGVVAKMPLRYDYKDGRPTYIQDEYHTLYDPDRNSLHPPVTGIVGARPTRTGQQPVIGIADREVLMRRKMSPMWYEDNADTLPDFIRYVHELKEGDLEKVASEDRDRLYRYKGDAPPSGGIQLVYKYKINGADKIVLPAWRKGKFRQRIQASVIQELTRPHSLSVSDFRVYSLTPTLYRLKCNLTSVLDDIFGNTDNGKCVDLRLEENPQLTVTLERRAKYTIVVHDTHSIVIRRERIRELIASTSLVQLLIWNQQGTRALLDHFAEFFAFDVSDYDVVDGQLRLL